MLPSTSAHSVMTALSTGRSGFCETSRLRCSRFFGTYRIQSPSTSGWGASAMLLAEGHHVLTPHAAE
jgi:hypothetical protein